MADTNAWQVAVQAAGGFGLAVAALYGGVWACGLHQVDERLRWGLVGLANLLTFWYLTLVVTAAFDGAHDGQASGHEGLSVAGAWALYGLGLALAARRWPHRYLRHGARAVLAAALVFLLLGALLANARWALPGYRYFAYAAVLGGVWTAERLLGRHEEDGDVEGILSLTAAFGGFGVAGFEVIRWLEPLFTRPTGTPLSTALLLWERSTTVFAHATVWSLYALVLMAAGVRLPSARTRLLAMGGFAWSLLYVAAQGLNTLAASPWLRAAAFAAAVPGGLAAWYMARRADGERHPWEWPGLRLWPWVTAGMAVIWLAIEAI